MTEVKRVTLFMGHYGSGKTFTAVNYATYLSAQGKKVSIYDMDIVNPYFRTVDAEKFLSDNGVELVVSPYAETNVDIPAMNAKSYRMIHDKTRYAVLDIGGDERGALALGRFYEEILKENDYNAFWVVNPYRIETRNFKDALAIKDEIESAARIKFTGIVNCANLGEETTADTVLYGKKFCDGLSEITGLPVVFSAVRQDLADKTGLKDVLPIRPIKYVNWI